MSPRPDRPVGLTGARFGRVRRDSGPSDTPADAAPDTPAGAASDPATRDARDDRPMPSGARFPRAPRRPAGPPRLAPAPPAPEPHPAASSPGTGPSSDYDTGENDVDAVTAPTVQVRPYVHTGGRTRTHSPLPIEALVCAVPGSSTLRLYGTHRSVLDLCRVPQSVAEVSARLGVPLAVARVLVDDLVAQQVVTVQRGVDQNAPDLALMRRVLAGLQRL